MALILASGSPRRRELMSLITSDYTVITSDVDETKIAADSPAHLAKALATAKARAVAEENPDDVVCGFDTVVECEGEVFGKPKDEADAVRMLRALSGREHRAQVRRRRAGRSVLRHNSAGIQFFVLHNRGHGSLQKRGVRRAEMFPA